MTKTAKVSHWPLTILGSVSSLFNIFLPIVMSRKMSPTSVGEFKIFFLYLLAVPALSLGIGYTNGTYLWGSDPIDGNAKARSAFLLSLFSGFAAGAFVLAAGAWLGWSGTLVLFAAACPPVVGAAVFEASLVARGQVRRAAFFTAGFEFLRTGAVLSAILLELGLHSVVALYVIASWLKLFAAGFGLGIFSPLDPTFRRLRPGLLKYAIPVSVAAIFDLLVLNADRYVLSTLLLPSDYAIYAFGCLMIPPLFVVEQSINQVLIPKLARAEAGSRESLAHFRAALEDLLLVLLPATAGLIALAEPLTLFLFTERYRDGAVFMAWYGVFYTLLAIPQDVLARARGDGGWILRASVIFGVLALAASLIGAKYFGALGALKAFLLIQAGRRAYALLYFTEKERCAFAKMFPVQTALVLAGSASAALLVARQVSRLFERPAQSVMAGGALFAAVYLGLVYLFRPRVLQRLRQLRKSQ